MMKDKFEKAMNKIRAYKDKINTLKAIIKDLTKANPSSKANSDQRVQLTAEFKKKIREEEITKRDKEIERQRKLMSQKSEEQSILLNQKIEELEAKLEAKNNECEECDDLLIKISEHAQNEEKLRKKIKELQKPFFGEDEDLNELTDPPVNKDNQANNYEMQIKMVEKMEKLSEKIIEYGEKIGEFKVETLEKI